MCQGTSTFEKSACAGGDSYGTPCTIFLNFKRDSITHKADFFTCTVCFLTGLVGEASRHPPAHRRQIHLHQ